MRLRQLFFALLNSNWCLYLFVGSTCTGPLITHGNPGSGVVSLDSVAGMSFSSYLLPSVALPGHFYWLICTSSNMMPFPLCPHTPWLPFGFPVLPFSQVQKGIFCPVLHLPFPVTVVSFLALCLLPGSFDTVGKGPQAPAVLPATPLAACTLEFIPRF